MSGSLSSQYRRGGLLCLPFKPRKYLKRPFFVQAGDVYTVESFVIKGCLCSYFVDTEANCILFSLPLKIGGFPNMEGLLKGVPSKLNIDALEDTEVLQITKADFDKLLNRFPRFERMFRLMLQRIHCPSKSDYRKPLRSTRDRYLNFHHNHRPLTNAYRNIRSHLILA